ncbi:hypothetical protein FRC12_012259 [Ceratobasidium sp. 428]|nr:hypothetical protein FRC12_012259 [Ceratobasidium sp. 428]
MARRTLSVTQATGHEFHIDIPFNVAVPNFAPPPHTPPVAPPVALPAEEPLLASLFGLIDDNARGLDE